MLPQALPQLLGVVVAAAGREEGGRRVHQASRGWRSAGRRGAPPPLLLADGLTVAPH